MQLISINVKKSCCFRIGPQHNKVCWCARKLVQLMVVS